MQHTRFLQKPCKKADCDADCLTDQNIVLSIHNRKAAKRLTSVLFTNKGDCVVISDKAGDVHRLIKTRLFKQSA